MFRLINGTVSSVNITAVQVTPTNQFSIISNGCPSTLTAGAHCSIIVQFRANRAGLTSGTLSVTDNVSDSAQTSALTGYGFAGGSGSNGSVAPRSNAN